MKNIKSNFIYSEEVMSYAVREVQTRNMIFLGSHFTFGERCRILTGYVNIQRKKKPYYVIHYE